MTRAMTRATTAAAIIAGGRGTRMVEAGAGADGGAGPDAGVTKALLVVDGRRIIDRQLEVLRRCFDDVVLVANDPVLVSSLGSEPNIRVVADRVPGGIGPLAGLDAALDALPGAADAVVCVAGDMPFLSQAVLEMLRDRAPAAVALVPRIDGRPEPLLARYGRACAPLVREQIGRGEYAVQRLLERLPATFLDEAALRAIDPGLRSFVNVNTPDDLAAAEPGAPSRREDRGRHR
jgi:molybdopterin-guanine dinucleotide biosynthesis protein A